MAVTVVINRDYDGVTTCREVYAAGTKYAIGSSNLQIFSASSQLIALYGSGNWLSVHVDDPVEPVGGVDGGHVASPAAAAAAAAAAARLAADPAFGDHLSEAEAVSAPPDEDEADVAPVVHTPVPLRAADDDGAEPAHEYPLSSGADPGWGLSDRLAARSSTLRPVVFRARTYRAARADAAPAPEPPDERTSMRPVVFRARTYRAARPSAPPRAADDDA